jgi:hypothetical protein
VSGPWEKYSADAQDEAGPWARYAAPVDQPSTLDKWKGAAADTGKWFATQMGKGTAQVLGAPQSIGDLAVQGGEWAGGKIGAPEMGRNAGQGFKNVITFNNILPTTEGINNTLFGGGDSPRPQAQAFGVKVPQMGLPEVDAGNNPSMTAHDPLGFMGIKGDVNFGKMLDTGAQAIPGALMLGGGILPAALGGVTSEAAGQATEGSKWEIPARVAGALPGVMLGTKLTTPLPANLSPEQARAVEIAKSQGIPLSVSQETGRLKGVERSLARYPTSSSQFEELASKQGAASDAAALRTMGFEGDNVGTEAMKAATNQARGEFQSAINNIPRVELRPDFYNRSNAVRAAYEDLPGDSTIASVVGKRIDDFMDPKLVKGGPYPELSGEQFQAFRKGISDTVDKLYALPMGQGATAAKALQNVRDALDDAAQASLPADAAEAMKKARANYANFKVIERAAGRGTVASRSEGTLAPSALTMELRKRQRDAFSHTTGGLNDVASVKQYLSDSFPNSGTPTVSAAQNLMTGGMFTSPAALAGYAVGGPVGAVVGGAASTVVGPNMAARALTGQGWATPAGPLLPLPASVVRNYLANQALPYSRPEAIGMGYRTVSPLLLQDARARQ